MGKTLNALIYPSAPSVIAERRMIDVETIPTNKVSWWRPVVVVGDDTFDPLTQKKTGPVTTIEKDRVVDTYEIVALTALELSERKDARLSSIDTLQFAIAYDIENRVRVLEGKPQLTAGQYRAAIKARL